MNCDIEGVVIRALKRHEDHRGWLVEVFRHDELEDEFHPAMSYVSMTRPGIVRGPHEHRDQADLFAFVGPSTFRLWLWDNRPNSPTFRTRYVLDAGEEAPTMAVVPAGVVHAYKNVGKVDGLVFNAPNRLFMGPDKSQVVDEIRYEDKPDSPFQLFE